MRKFCARMALYLYFKLEGGIDLMAMLFAQRVILGNAEFTQVPAKLQREVATILVEECGMPDLVPEEFGGTAKEMQ